MTKDEILAAQIAQMAKLQTVSVYKLLTKHGGYYTPKPLSKPYERGEIKQCYMNAYKLSEKHSLHYIEGVALPDFMDMPIEHAWCVDNDGNVIDNTWPIVGTAYCGVPFTDDLIVRVLCETGVYGVMNWQSATFRNWYNFMTSEKGTIHASSFAVTL